MLPYEPAAEPATCSMVDCVHLGEYTGPHAELLCRQHALWLAKQIGKVIRRRQFAGRLRAGERYAIPKGKR